MHVSVKNTDLNLQSTKYDFSTFKFCMCNNNVFAVLSLFGYVNSLLHTMFHLGSKQF